jgi:hypothetical protein
MLRDGLRDKRPALKRSTPQLKLRAASVFPRLRRDECGVLSAKFNGLSRNLGWGEPVVVVVWSAPKWTFGCGSLLARKSRQGRRRYGE